MPLSIFYWMWNDPRMLILIQAATFCLSGIPVFLLAKQKKITGSVTYALLISYLAFYGVQNALWFDVHSAVFGAAFIPWFLYFLDKKNVLWCSVFFLLAIISKENIALLTFLISLVYCIKRRQKAEMYFAAGSLLYLLCIFGIYFPHFTERGYEYQSNQGLTGDIDLWNVANTPNKQQVWLLSLGWFSFIPLLAPLTLLPFLGDLFSYFVIANNLKEADGIFMHYRVTLAPLLIWSTIVAIAQRKYLQKWYITAYLLIIVAIAQFLLHTPLSYVTKKWFWQEPAAVRDINSVIAMIPHDAALVSQNNITPHVDHRKAIFTLWPNKKTFIKDSPCGKRECNWFHWYGKQTYLIVDTSSNWDIRHYLTNREDFSDGLKNIEKAGIIKKYKQQGNTVLYKIQKSP
jgi:uncharacterized membrane protein